MSGYISLNRTGFAPFDDALSSIEEAGDSYHHTSQWLDDGWNGEKPYIDQINERIAFAADKYSDVSDELTRLQSENAELRSIISENVKEIERVNKQQEPEGVRVSQEPAMHPMQQILDGDRELFLLENRYELKYLPIYANIPDPTYVVKWVWEVRDANGCPVAKASEWLYHAIDLARGMAGIASAPTDLAAKVVDLQQRISDLEAYGNTRSDEMLAATTHISELTEQVKVAKAALKVARDGIDEFLVANDPTEFGCACDLSVGYLCGPCHADKQQQPLKSALAKINEVLYD